ncbi:MAG: shikimate kinase [Cellulosilyticaceae bacterium]
MNHKIYLVGFMGCGKTTIGTLLGKRIGIKSIDLDDYIIHEAKMRIPEIFEKYGEGYFRELEHTCLCKVGEGGAGIICTGGGVVGRRDNRAFLKDALCIYLKVDFDILYGRIAEDSNRPLATDYERLKALYESRQAWYEEVATYQIIGDEKTPLQVVDELIQLIK